MKGENMKEVDQLAKSIKLNFNCPRCGKHIGYIIESFPQPDLSAENFADSVVSDSTQILCLSCKKETFDVDMFAGNGDKNLTISNSNSLYPINEEDVEIIVIKTI